MPKRSASRKNRKKTESKAKGERPLSVEELKAAFLERQKELNILTPRVQALWRVAESFERQMREILRSRELPERTWLQKYIDADILHTLKGVGSPLGCIFC
jgi:hypothetical protein